MSSTSRKRIVLGALIVACTLCVGIAVRGELRRNAPEPEHCVLCDSGYTCHAPALLNLATGEIAELEVYALDPRLPDEVDKTRKAHITRIGMEQTEAWYTKYHKADQSV